MDSTKLTESVGKKMSHGNIFAGHLSLSTKSGFMFKNFYCLERALSYGARVRFRVLNNCVDSQTSSAYLFRSMLFVLLIFSRTIQAQELRVSSVTPNSLCAGSSISVSFSYGAGRLVGTAYLFLNGPGTTDVMIGAASTLATGGSIVCQGIIPVDRVTGNYTVRIFLLYNGEDSGAFSPISEVFSINELPPTPTVSYVAYCQGATPVPLPSGNAQNPVWYVSSSGGIGSTVAPAPPTSTPGVQNYYVSQKVNGCESRRSTIRLTINPLPFKPSVASPLSFCQNSAISLLTEAVTGGNIKWYDSSEGVVVPSTLNPGTFNYYVSQTDRNGCESPWTDISVTINPVPELTVLPADQTIFTGAETIAINFNGSIEGTEFSWSNDNTATGLAASGAGVTGIPAFVTTGTGTSTVTVTPTLGSCSGTPVSFKLTVSDKTPDLRPYLIVENPGFSNDQTTSNVSVRIRNMTAETTASGLVTVNVNKPTEESTLVLTPASAESWTIILAASGTHYILTSNVSIPAGPLGVKIEGILTMPSESPIGKYNLDASISAGSAGEALADDVNNGVETLVFKN